MQLGKRTWRFSMAAAVVAGSVIASVGWAGSAKAADQLPRYTADGFCVTRTLNLGQPSIKGETCSGLYKVTKATYKFTEDNLHLDPKMGILVHLDESWISPPQGGAPTILASFRAYL